MHELSVAQKIIEVIEAEAKKNGMAKVRLARLKVGKMAAFQKEQLEFCLATYEKGKALDGISFEIEEIPVELACESCKKSFPDSRFDDLEFAHHIAHAPGLYLPPPCPSCGHESAKVIKGREMELISIEGD